MSIAKSLTQVGAVSKLARWEKQSVGRACRKLPRRAGITGVGLAIGALTYHFALGAVAAPGLVTVLGFAVAADLSSLS